MPTSIFVLVSHLVAADGGILPSVVLRVGNRSCKTTVCLSCRSFLFS